MGFITVSYKVGCPIQYHGYTNTPYIQWLKKMSECLYSPLAFAQVQCVISQ